MEVDYTKIRIGNWLYRHCFPLYNFVYTRFKLRNDADEIALLKRTIKPGDAVLDIGANIGFYARLLSKFTGENGSVYCFEPDATNFARLKSNTRGLKNVHLINAAVSDVPGPIKVYKSKLLNVDHRTYPVEGYDSIEETSAVSVDNLIAKEAIRSPSVIKIDIQGYEMTAFSGMKQLLSSAAPPTIITEYWPHGFRRAGTSSAAFFDFFAALQYTIYAIEGPSLRKFSREEAVATAEKPFEYSMNVLIRREG